MNDQIAELMSKFPTTGHETGAQTRQAWDSKVDPRLTEVITNDIKPYFNGCLIFPEEIADMLQWFGYTKLVEIISRAQLTRVSYLQKIKSDADKQLSVDENASQNHELVKQAMSSDQ